MKKLLCTFVTIIVLAPMQGVFASTIISQPLPNTLTPSIQAQLQRNTQIQRRNIVLARINKLRDARIAKAQANNKNIVALLPTNSIIQPVITPAITKTPSLSPAPLPVLASANYPVSSNIPGVDMNRVRSAWIDWLNSARREAGLSPYTYDARLDRSAADWNEVFADGYGYNHHRRNPGDAYFDYNVIQKWFANRGVVGKIVDRAAFSENVGYGGYYCSSGDCTDALINSIRSTFNFFMSEKGATYETSGAHYKSIMKPGFQKIGLAIKTEGGRYYLTVHYITEFQ